MLPELVWVLVRGGGRPPRQWIFSDRRKHIEIGAQAAHGEHNGAGVELAGPEIEPRHAVITFASNRYYVTDRRTVAGTWVNGLRIAKATEITEADQIRIGEYLLELQYEWQDGSRFAAHEGPGPWHSEEAVELELLAAIAADGDAGRAVYADWLEARGDTARASYLRLQDEIAGSDPRDPFLQKRTKQLHRVAATIDVRWRAAVGRAPIAHCPVRFELQCPRGWSSLTPTGDPSVRSCSTCRRDVYFCATPDEARARARGGECVALALGVPEPADGLLGSRHMMAGVLAPDPEHRR